MRGTGKTIDALYFGYSPVAGHAQGCPRHGTDTWDVTRFSKFGLNDQVTETVIRLACDKCGVVAFTSFDGDRSTETTHADVIGFAASPRRSRACGCTRDRRSGTATTALSATTSPSRRTGRSARKTPPGSWHGQPARAAASAGRPGLA
jgi:hypothetical protein